MKKKTSYGFLLKKIRKEKELSQDEMAEIFKEIGIAKKESQLLSVKNHISAYERGVKFFSLNKIAILCEYLNLDFDFNLKISNDGKELFSDNVFI